MKAINQDSTITPIVCVNYNSEKDCFNYATKHGCLQNPIIIIDNSPVISIILEKLSDNKSIFYYFINENVGYLNALGIGITHANLLFPNYKFIALTNVDLMFENKALNLHISENGNEYMDKKIGIIGPEILSSQTELNQNPFLHKRPNKWKIKAWIHIAFNSHIGAIYHALSEIKNNIFSFLITRKEKNPSKSSEIVYSVHGSFFLLSRDFIDSIQPIRWPCFLFSEELWFSEMARLKLFKAICTNKFTIIHKEHITTGTIKSKKRIEWHRESMCYIYNTFFQ